MIEFEEVEEAFESFLKLLKEYCKEGWWDLDFHLKEFKNKMVAI